MFYIIIENIRKDDYIVDKNSTMIVISFQRPVYKTLYIKRGVRKSYEDYFRTLYSLLIDKSESIAVIKVYGQLKEEVGYIDYCDISLSTNRINNVLLKG